MKPVGTLHSGSNEEIIVALKDRNVEIGDLLYARASDNVWLVLHVIGRTIININREAALYAYSRLGRTVESSIVGSPHIDVANVKPLFQVHEDGHLEVVVPTSIPPGGTPAYLLEEGDEELRKLVSGLSKPGTSGFCGYLRSGRRYFRSAPLMLSWGSTIPHQVLVTGMTGSGKSNFVKSLIAWYVSKRLVEHDVKIGFLVLDHHSEYHGVRLEVEGLGSLPYIAKENDHIFHVYLPGYYYETLSKRKGFDQTLYFPLKIPSNVIDPDHVALFADFTEAQTDILHAICSMAQANGDSWVRMLIKSRPRELALKISRHGLTVKDVTIETLRRKLIRVLGFRILREGVDDSRSVFSIEPDENLLASFRSLVETVENGGVIILDFSMVPEVQATIVSATIIDAIFEDRMLGKGGDSVVAVVSEEAPKYLNPKMARSPANVFARVAREGRKFNIGLIAITQSCSLLERQIVANMNTIIAFRTTYRGDLDMLAQSGLESGDLPFLMKGEAIVQSTFLNILSPVPVKFPKASEYLREVTRRLSIKEKNHGDELGRGII